MNDVLESNGKLENLEPAEKTKKGRHGGARPGSGRPKGCLSEATIKGQIAKERLRELAAQHVDRLVSEALRIATESDSDQARIAAIKELFDRGFGKSTQVVAGDPDNPVDVRHSAIEFVVVTPRTTS